MAAAAAGDAERVHYVGSNRHADYFKVDGAFNVIVQSSTRAPLYCLDCRKADCLHVTLVSRHGQPFSPREVPA